MVETAPNGRSVNWGACLQGAILKDVTTYTLQINIINYCHINYKALQKTDMHMHHDLK